MITKRKIGSHTEYTETIKGSCGCIQTITTLNYKMERRQVAIKKQNPCPACQLKSLLYRK